MLNDFPALEAGRTALVNIDMQNAFLADGQPYGNANGRDVVPRVNRLSRAMRAAGAKVIWTRQTYTAEPPLAPADWQYDAARPGVAAGMAALHAGSPGHALYPGMDVAPSDIVLDKFRYGAFSCPARALPDTLERLRIAMIVITGTLTNCCCESTAREANMAGQLHSAAFRPRRHQHFVTVRFRLGQLLGRGISAIAHRLLGDLAHIRLHFLQHRHQLRVVRLVVHRRLRHDDAGLRVRHRLRIVGRILAPFARHQPRLRLLRVQMIALRLVHLLQRLPNRRPQFLRHLQVRRQPVLARLRLLRRLHRRFRLRQPRFHPRQQLLQILPMLHRPPRRGRPNLRPIHGVTEHPDQPLLRRHLHRRPKHRAQRLPVRMPEPPQRAVIQRVATRQPDQRQVLADTPAPDRASSESATDTRITTPSTTDRSRTAAAPLHSAARENPAPAGPAPPQTPE